MRTGRLAIIKLASLTISEYIEQGQKDSKCMLCQHEFRIGENMLTHAIDNHKDWVHWKLLESQVMQQKVKKLLDNNYLNPLALTLKGILKPFNPFGEQEEKGESNSLEYQDRMFQAPRCKKCNHNDPEYDVVSSPPQKDGIQLKCVYCGNISVKD